MMPHLYTMKQICKKTCLSYETLKFYCNQGLVPNVKRDAQNRRDFDELDVSWINSLNCLRNCNMSIQEMKDYIALHLGGVPTIPQRWVILEKKRQSLEAEMKRIQEAIDYIDWKLDFYDEVKSGKIPFVSNLINTDE